MTEASESRAVLRTAGALPLLWAGGAALRVGFVLFEPETAPIADETMWLMALNRLPEASFSPLSNYPIFHPPLYPYFLAVVNALFGSLLAVKLAQALIGSLLVPAVFRIARTVFGARAAVVAGLLAAGYPELIWYSAHFWCETLFLSLFWWAIQRLVAADETGSGRVAIGAGVLFGLAVLTRETALYLLPVAAFWLSRPDDRFRRGGLALAALLGALAVIAPWTLRNWVQFQAFIPVSTGGGLNLYQGNALLSRDEVYGAYYANEGKVEQYRWARTEGVSAIMRRQPGWFLEKIRDEGPRLAELDSLALIHVRRGAYPGAACGAYGLAAGVVLLPWVLIAIGSVLALSRIRIERQTVLLITLIGIYLLLHIGTHGFSRYRLPVMPGLMLVAASLFDRSGRGAWTPWRKVLLIGAAAALALLWAPSLLDQMGHLGLAAPPTYEGFAPICP